MILKIEITKSCDQSCLHCPYSRYFSQNQNHLTLTDLQNQINSLRQQRRLPPNFEVLITGGEPLLNPQLWEMINYLRLIGAQTISLATNGLPLINNSILQARLQHIDELIISLSSSVSEYQKLRGQDMNQVMTALGQIKQNHPKLTITANYLAHSQNYSDLTRLAQNLKDSPFHLVRFLTYEASLAPKSSPLQNLNQRELLNLQKLVRNHNRQVFNLFNRVKRLLNLPGAKKVAIVLVPFERDGEYADSDDLYLSAA